MVEARGFEPRSWIDGRQVSTRVVRDSVLVLWFGSAHARQRKQRSVCSRRRGRPPARQASLMRTPLSPIRRQSSDVAAMPRVRVRFRYSQLFF